ncbi:cupin domain-containing protein [Denitratisoma oestradiolicum]|uniref:Cupin n=1 Tax=Denitratisoma oestradiolicum TaxID=311182 RepID=A0A6S6Y4H3_9PROT|nr:cupin domain-containing protein [Denitratisoma oestradiolicum]TWO80447.1 cupin [Denitratisoma oestradiolicum]CAB1370260.1 Cupin [Denitratisoma oestradiolicum]
MKRALSTGRLLAGVQPEGAAGERFDDLLRQPGLRIERIVSTGQVSPPDFWYDQSEGEWVLLVAGQARLLIEGEGSPRFLKAGDWIDLPPHCRHRVEWTDPECQTIWLAVYYAPPVGGD